MATPVPVVSMMYFLVSTPPKMFCAVRPAFAAMSTKVAMGAGGGAGFDGCAQSEAASSRDAQARARRNRVFGDGEEIGRRRGTGSMVGAALAGVKRGFGDGVERCGSKKRQGRPPAVSRSVILLRTISC